MISPSPQNLDASQKQSWLQHLKDASWEAELLVSTVAIYAILQSFKLLDWLIFQFIDKLDPSQYNIGYMILVFGYLAIGILTSMFVIHFSLRAYWIGLVGLNSAFPDYGLEDSAYSPIYTKKILGVLPKISTSINKIDELCSVIFSAAFAFMLIYFYGMITTSIYLILYNILDDYVPSWVLLIPLAPIVLIFVFGILISIPANMKKYHNNERIQHLYFLYAHWGAMITYGPIYKSVFQITMLFGSNFKKKKGLVKMILLMLLLGVIFGMTKLINSNYTYLINYDLKVDESTVHKEYYASKNTDARFLFVPEIQNDLVSEHVINLFVPIFDHETAIMGENCELPKLNLQSEEISRQERWKANLDCYAASVSIFLDNQAVPVDFLKIDHPRSDQFGLQGFVDLQEIPLGTHRLKIVKSVSSEIQKTWEIPFYYTPN
ncbi:hypothetical protein [Maribacter sp. 4G9]|uniref:hypothetical protein n=1 Tax=Maribacter sp. 4G9 TaxID=1889777 RepID=UPI000C154A1F|nr:hypothetical protein [Maribacter sp. 4G9]PIB29501.1 hypothetical protein BFP75_03515 [Maribacter sp. 4G9]